MMAKLPQADMYFTFMKWMQDHLYFEHGWSETDSFYAAFHGGRDFLMENNIKDFPDERFDWSRPSAVKVAQEYILREG